MNRTTNFVVGALTCLIAGASIMTMHLGDAGAATECLAAPNKATPAGQHWFYRVERGTSRHCWYLGDESKPALHAAKSTAAHPAETLIEADRATVLARTAANVHAEIPLPQSNGDDANVAAAAPIAAAAPQSESAAQGPPNAAAIANPQTSLPQLPVASPQPDQAIGPSIMTEPPKASAPAATADANSAAKNDADAAAATAPMPAASPAAVAPAATAAATAAVPVSRLDAAPSLSKATSLSAFFLAAFGALVFVTLAMGLSYFFSDRARRQSEPDDRWTYEDWPPEPFQIPSSLQRLPHGSFIADTLRSASQPEPEPDNTPRENDVRQIEQLLMSAVRRSESLRGHIEDYASSRSSA